MALAWLSALHARPDGKIIGNGRHGNTPVSEDNALLPTGAAAGRSPGSTGSDDGQRLDKQKFSTKVMGCVAGHRARHVFDPSLTVDAVTDDDSGNPHRR
jgi:hypothetical protein